MASMEIDEGLHCGGNMGGHSPNSYLVKHIS